MDHENFNLSIHFYINLHSYLYKNNKYLGKYNLQIIFVGLSLHLVLNELKNLHTVHIGNSVAKFHFCKPISLRAVLCVGQQLCTYIHFFITCFEKKPHGSI